MHLWVKKLTGKILVYPTSRLMKVTDRLKLTPVWESGFGIQRKDKCNEKLVSDWLARVFLMLHSGLAVTREYRIVKDTHTNRPSGIVDLKVSGRQVTLLVEVKHLGGNYGENVHNAYQAIGQVLKYKKLLEDVEGCRAITGVCMYLRAGQAASAWGDELEVAAYMAENLGVYLWLASPDRLFKVNLI